MIKPINQNNFLIKTILISLIVIIFSSLCPTGNLRAQFDEFNNRIIEDHVFAMFLYRDKLLNDEYRPVYHFVIPEGIAHPFDPNGAIYWQNRYHLFYIFQTVKPLPYYRGDAWAHISSHDLVHWRFHPTALKPDDESPERAIYSGNAFIDKEGVPTVMYHGLGAGNCIARADDEDNLDDWEKHEANPVIPHPEYVLDNDDAEYRAILDDYPDYGEHDVWDPHAWLEGDTYYAISGDNGLWPGKKAALYKSDNLKDWQLVGDFFHHGDEKVRGRLDCPDFFKLGDKYVLFYLRHGLEYMIGEFKNEQFYPEKQGTLTWLNGMGYAPESLVDDKGRRIMWAALNDSRTRWGGLEEFITQHGWCGAMTLPRVLSLDKNKNLKIQPVKELESLRYGHFQKRDLKIDNGSVSIGEFLGRALELDLTMVPKGAQSFGIKVCYEPDGAEQTVIWYDVGKQKVYVDLSRTSLDPRLMKNFYEDHGLLQEADLKLKDGEPLHLRIFIDSSVLEVFVNSRLCLTHRIYPMLEDSEGIELFSKGGAVEVPVFNGWKMHPSNPW